MQNYLFFGEEGWQMHATWYARIIFLNKKSQTQSNLQKRS